MVSVSPCCFVNTMLTWNGFTPLSSVRLRVAFEPDLTGALGPVVFDDAGRVEGPALRHLAVITGINASVTPAGGPSPALPVRITSSVLSTPSATRGRGVLWCASSAAQRVTHVTSLALALALVAAIYTDCVSVRTAQGRQAALLVVQRIRGRSGDDIWSPCRCSY